MKCRAWTGCCSAYIASTFYWQATPCPQDEPRVEAQNKPCLANPTPALNTERQLRRNHYLTVVYPTVPSIPGHSRVRLIIACALFPEIMEPTVIATSLPTIVRDLHEDPIALKLALTSYLLSLSVIVPISG